MPRSSALRAGCVGHFIGDRDPSARLYAFCALVACTDMATRQRRVRRNNQGGI